MSTSPHSPFPHSAAPPEDHRLSPRTGYTRAHWEWAADSMLAAVRPYATPSGSLLDLPGPASVSGRWSDGLEGYARTFLLAAFRAAHAADPEPVVAPYATGIAAGTDPASPERWPTPEEIGQARVEAASVALALHETRAVLWDRLDDGVRERAVAWLSQMSGIDVPQNNWVWFRAVVAAFLRSVGAPYSTADIERAVAATDGWYRGDGWYSDGDERNYDHYNAWAMHLYPLWYCRITGDTPETAALSARYRERLSAFLQDAAPYLVGGDGAPLFQGRSLTYRFAAAAPFFNGALFDANPLPPGLTRRAASGMLRYFLDRGATEENGLLSLGWHRRFEPVRQPYSGPASPYWASKGFTGLLLPPDHPVWTAQEQDLPVERGDFTRALPVPGWLVSGTASDGVVRISNHGTDHTPPYHHVYSRRAYSTHAAPDYDGPDPDRETPVEPLSLTGRTALSRSGGITTASAVNGPWEVRVVHAKGSDPVRIPGHTLAGAAAPSGDHGLTRRADGLTSALLVLYPAFNATVTLHRAQDVNPYGTHSATPVYEAAASAGAPHAVALYLGSTPPGTLPTAPRLALHPTAPTATVTWPDGQSDTFPTGAA
ncbi:DUF2264 domain-containing protein [Streptomyces sp. NPDC049879]|uniref:DUF2264 domain-containing protein n=1 Tax=Streptomyces sp. NPDC049879 TaxID=3365598 RepID=UPI00378827B2